ncbi:MAG: hypothetical protein VB934_20495, partial [Polyangiaceae bacterium]
IHIAYLPRPKIARRLFGVLLLALQAAALRRGGTFVHGSMAQHPDHGGVLLLGANNSRKTQILLTMLREGWDFLCDDKSLLLDGKCHSLDATIPICGHHIQALPWVGDALRNIGAHVGRPTSRRLRLAALRLLQVLPPPSLPGIAITERLNPTLRPAPSALFVGCDELGIAMPDRTLINVPGAELVCQPLETNTGLQLATEIQSRALGKQMDEALALMQKMSGEDWPTVESVLTNSLSQNRFLHLTLPPEAKIDIVYEEILRCLRQA